MRDKTNAFFSRSIFAVLVLAFSFGVVLGVFFSERQAAALLLKLNIETESNQNTLMGVFHSSLFFNHIIYLLVIFLFGLTFLGILVVPSSIFLKGTVYGIYFTVLFRDRSISEYIKQCFLYLPEAFCTVILIGFSVYAFCTSFGICKQLFNNRKLGVNLKKYVILFLVDFTITVVIAFGHSAILLLTANP